MSKPKLENLTIYTHWISMPCRFLQMVIRELDIDCNFHEIDFFGREHAKPEYQAINPAQPSLINPAQLTNVVVA